MCKYRYNASFNSSKPLWYFYYIKGNNSPRKNATERIYTSILINPPDQELNKETKTELKMEKSLTDQYMTKQLNTDRVKYPIVVIFIKFIAWKNKRFGFEE